MAEFSEISLGRLKSCHPDLQCLFLAVIRVADCSILCGHRGEQDQNAAFEAGNSKLKFPESKHNKTPSLAVDVAPWPIDWKDENKFKAFSETVKMVASQLDIKVKWGGDWEDFRDYPHWELA